MLSLLCRNVNEAFKVGMMHFRFRMRDNTLIESFQRGQRRLQYPMPITTTYQRPRERVLFDPVRDANPFFHFMESLWIIGGSNKVEWLKQWLPSIADYSDDGETFHGAYGFRIQNQLWPVINRLRTDHDTTRAVLAIYDAAKDSEYNGKDMPCNCTVFLGIQQGKLNMTVANRSNDMVWGAYGANAVQFSMLHEYLAACVEVEMGWYAQMSNNAHIYPDNEATQRVLTAQSLPVDYYDSDMESYVTASPMGITPKTLMNWHLDLAELLNGSTDSFRTPYFGSVVHPMLRAHHHYRAKNYDAAIDSALDIEAEDWRFACAQWLERRQAAAAAKAKQ